MKINIILLILLHDGKMVMALEIPNVLAPHLALTAAPAFVHCNVGTILVRSKSLGRLKIANKGCV